VAPDRPFGQHQLRGDLPVRQTFGDQAEKFSLPVREPRRVRRKLSPPPDVIGEMRPQQREQQFLARGERVPVGAEHLQPVLRRAVER
jgi:hypothetical protein